MVLVAVASVPSARPLQPEPLYPPKKNSLGKLGGIRSPPGLNTQHDSTKHDRKALQGQTDRTGQPTGTASTSTTRGQAARMASMATTRGAACPRRVSVDKTDMMIKMFLWAQQNKHTALLAVTCGLYPQG